MQLHGLEKVFHTNRASWAVQHSGGGTEFVGDPVPHHTSITAAIGF